MQNRHQSRALAAQRDRQDGAWKQWVAGSMIGVAALWAASELYADGHEVIIESHGFNEYGALKYGSDFPHLDYVNPDAPLGGEISISWSGSFDSMNPFATLSGTPGVLSSVIYERIMESTSDEVGSVYCLLCTTLNTLKTSHG